MKIIVSAPAKLHLMGEHVVVYGRPALLTAIDKRVYVKIKSMDEKGIKIHDNEPDDFVRYCLKVMRNTYHIKALSGLEMFVSSSIPLGAGLGSSAAVSVATIGALHLFLRKGWTPKTINELSYKVEKKQHGNPSGGDNTVVTFGGFLWFRKEFEFLRSMWQLPIGKENTLLGKFLLINSGRPKESTKSMIKLVKSKVENHPSKIERIFNNQEKLTKQMAIALKNEDEQRLMESITMGERNLEDIGVVGKIAFDMIETVESKGGAAKISGAGGVTGGSGMILCYHPEPKLLHDLAKRKKWDVMSVRLGEKGIKSEVNSDYKCN